MNGGMPNEASKLATTKGMTTIFRWEEKVLMVKCTTPNQKDLRRGRWYGKTPPGRPPNKDIVLTKELIRGFKTRQTNPHGYSRRMK